MVLQKMLVRKRNYGYLLQNIIRQSYLINYPIIFQSKLTDKTENNDKIERNIKKLPTKVGNIIIAYFLQNIER